MTKESTDQELIDFMKESTTVNDWNERRKQLKKLRSQEWISTNLDCTGLIVKTLKQTAL